MYDLYIRFSPLPLEEFIDYAYKTSNWKLDFNMNGEAILRLPLVANIAAETAFPKYRSGVLTIGSTDDLPINLTYSGITTPYLIRYDKSPLWDDAGSSLACDPYSLESLLYNYGFTMFKKNILFFNNEKNIGLYSILNNANSGRLVYSSFAYMYGLNKEYILNNNIWHMLREQIEFGNLTDKFSSVVNYEIPPFKRNTHFATEEYNREESYKTSDERITEEKNRKKDWLSHKHEKVNNIIDKVSRIRYRQIKYINIKRRLYSHIKWHRKNYNYMRFKNYRHHKLTKIFYSRSGGRLREVFQLVELSLINIILRAHFFDKYTEAKFAINHGFISVNGVIQQDINYVVQSHDIVNMTCIESYFALYRDYFSASITREYRTMHYFGGWLNLRNKPFKTPKSSMPKWSLKNLWSLWDIPKYLEVDFLSMSIIILYNPTYYSDFFEYFLKYDKLPVRQMFNWKYKFKGLKKNIKKTVIIR